jgi:hypothetical protein
MRIDFDYLEEMYDEEPKVQMIRRTKIMENTEDKRKNNKDYTDARKIKYGQSND